MRNNRKKKNEKKKKKRNKGTSTAQYTFRVGIGFDIHRFRRSSRKNRRKLVLGQVEFDFVGLEGASSDVDVVLHAISDAILGASGSPDIGTIFPPKSSQGISSREILEKALSIAKEKGFSVENVDCVIVAQKPKIGDKINDMKKKLKDILDCDINIRVKSPEGLGSLGRVEGISATSVALLKKTEKRNKKKQR